MTRLTSCHSELDLESLITPKEMILIFIRTMLSSEWRREESGCRQRTLSSWTWFRICLKKN